MLLAAEVAAPETLELTMVVFAPGDGVAPFPLPKDGELGEVARNNT